MPTIRSPILTRQKLPETKVDDDTLRRHLKKRHPEHSEEISPGLRKEDARAENDSLDQSRLGCAAFSRAYRVVPREGGPRSSPRSSRYSNFKSSWNKRVWPPFAPRLSTTKFPTLSLDPRDLLLWRSLVRCATTPGTSGEEPVQEELAERASAPYIQ